MHRKAYQQQTLSIRISEAMREYLERSKKIISAERGEPYTTSDVAKLLLESARADQPDFRLDVAELQVEPTESMVAIRRKWQRHQPLSRAELLFLALYIRAACEEVTEDPEMPDAEAYIAVLESVLALRNVRTHPYGEAVDPFYKEAIAVNDLDEFNARDTADVADLYTNLIRELRASPATPKPIFAGRAFFMAVRSEAIPPITATNQVLRPFLPTLFRLAVRGHWIRERRPVRMERAGPLDVAFVPPVTAEGYQIIPSVTAEGELELAVAMTERHCTYLLGSYPQIREFAALLRQLTPGQMWNGRHFQAWADSGASDGPAWFNFARHTDRVRFSFPEREWLILKDLFSKVIGAPGLKPILDELGTVYGLL